MPAEPEKKSVTTNQPSSPTTGEKAVSSKFTPYRWPLVVVAIAVVLLLAYQSTIRLVPDALNKASEGLSKIADRFANENITTTFTASLPEIDSKSGGNLEVATATAVETFGRENTKRVLWDMISLGTTVTRIKAPVTYRYHIRLSDEWHIDVRDETCVVYAPRIRPSLPPAIHTDKMEKETDEGWLRFNAETQMTELEKSLTPTLSNFAARKSNLDLIREKSRRTVAEFIRAWLLREEQWQSGRFSVITVIFEDEKEDENAPQISKPTITIGDSIDKMD